VGEGLADIPATAERGSHQWLPNLPNWFVLAFFWPAAQQPSLIAWPPKNLTIQASLFQTVG
jgi:hypothetical protein